MRRAARIASPSRSAGRLPASRAERAARDADEARAHWPYLTDAGARVVRVHERGLNQRAIADGSAACVEFSYPGSIGSDEAIGRQRATPC